MNADQLAKLREPFADNRVGKLPRVTCKRCSEAPSRVCSDHQKTRCKLCANYITTEHIDLDFVGHAVVTDRLLDVDPEWTWEPVAFAPDGSPLIRYEGRDGKRAVMWIRLTVAGVTRLGVGIAPANKDEVEKELIGDALRNAAMRFGVALNLWSKQDLHDSADGASAPPQEPGSSDGRAAAEPQRRSRPSAACKVCEEPLAGKAVKKDDAGAYVHVACVEAPAEPEQVPA